MTKGANEQIWHAVLIHIASRSNRTAESRAFLGFWEVKGTQQLPALSAENKSAPLVQIFVPIVLISADQVIWNPIAIEVSNYSQ